MGKEEIVKQEEVIVTDPRDNFVIEGPADDIRNAEASLDTTPTEQESKQKEELEASKETTVKEDVKVEEDKDQQHKKSRSQRRIERQSKELKDLKAEVETLKANPKKGESVTKEPLPEDFEDFNEYEEALETFNESKEVVAKPANNEAPKADARIAEMREDGAEDYKDFEELVSAPDLELTQEVLEEVLDCEAPSEVMYHLAKNKTLTKKLSTMSKRAMQKEIVKIEVALEAAPQTKEVKASNAPEPINPLNGGSETVRTLKDTKSFKEYERLRHQDRKNAW